MATMKRTLASTSVMVLAACSSGSGVGDGMLEPPVQVNCDSNSKGVIATLC